MTNAILGRSLLFGEVIGVDAFDLVAGLKGDAETVVDHEGGEFFAVDEDDAGVVFRGGGEGFLGEGGGGDENAFLGAMFGEGAGEFLDPGAADGIFPAFGLEVDAVETEAVFVDDAVDPAVAAAADGTTGVPARAALAHAEEEFDPEAFAEVGRGGGNTGEDVSGQVAFELGVDEFDLLSGTFALLR